MWKCLAWGPLAVTPSKSSLSKVTIPENALQKLQLYSECVQCMNSTKRDSNSTSVRQGKSSISKLFFLPFQPRWFREQSKLRVQVSTMQLCQIEARVIERCLLSQTIDIDGSLHTSTGVARRTVLVTTRNSSELSEEAVQITRSPLLRHNCWPNSSRSDEYMHPMHGVRDYVLRILFHIGHWVHDISKQVL